MFFEYIDKEKVIVLQVLMKRIMWNKWDNVYFN